MVSAGIDASSILDAGRVPQEPQSPPAIGRLRPAQQEQPGPALALQPAWRARSLPPEQQAWPFRQAQVHLAFAALELVLLQVAARERAEWVPVPATVRPREPPPPSQA